MTVAPPIDLIAAWDAHKAEVLADRDPHRISGSDLHGCDRALWNRYNGGEQLPYTNASFASFERGLAYEPRFFDAFSKEAEKTGLRLVWDKDRKVTHDGVEGHPDFTLYRGDELVAVIDPTTTASNGSDWSYGHALKSAFYAVALGVDLFAEFVVCIGFGGNILKVEPHWFDLRDESPIEGPDGPLTWREAVTVELARAKAVAALKAVPEAIPPTDPLDGTVEKWRCVKSYCRDATCPANARLKKPESGLLKTA